MRSGWRARPTITIDGPAGSGKSTLARRLARELGLMYLDTGAMYRALTWKAIRTGTPLEDPQQLEDLARHTSIAVSGGTERTHVLVDGRDVSDEIRAPGVTKKVHYVARVPGVRARMVELQREMGREGGVVVEGRDIGTVVFPDAEYKFFLDADVAERARRRHREMEEMGACTALRQVEREVAERDEKDRTRDVAPLKVAEGAVVMDSSSMTVDEEVEAVKRVLDADIR